MIFVLGAQNSSIIKLKVLTPTFIEFVGSRLCSKLKSFASFFSCYSSVAGTHISVPRNDGCCRDVLQEEPASSIPAGQLEWEALELAEASTACIGSLHGKISL